MAFDVRDKIIITVIFSIIGLISIVLIICFLCWFILRHYRSKAERMRSEEENNSPPISPYYRPQYQRSQKFSSTTKIHHNSNNTNNISKISNDKRRKKRRFNTNDSALTLSFDPPHLINQNVKNLEQLLSNDSTLTASSWQFEETLPRRYCQCKNLSNEPVYASSSTVLTAVSNLAVTPTHSNHTEYRFLTELDHVLRLKQEERVKHSLKHTQSCRQTTDLLPFDYYRSISPPSTITGTDSSNNNSLEPIYNRTNKCSNLTLVRKARLAQLRDDTAILY
ncbi:unnamed protein product [Rotaria socialis]|uniref:Uncharacterized protein n=1 Tax=Rotaria socialis TaxID=392032 RepID=A0A818G791_9BILA|nr:unnamed protein product [Rotaria socialis]CAF3430354.1 unnamed protein product [Rotaria socialis]CAF3485903.1 unnamed protein product [Rotaria socialis]CAF3653162.1 unnamed protein product [Rotaria socialis]CAF3687655.1 unnamed protein product [Rotaria socialis]